MSSMEKKVVLRAKIDKLKGKDMEYVYKYFLSKLGTQMELAHVELDYDTGKLEFFEMEGNLLAVCDYDTKEWGIDSLLFHKNEYRIKYGKEEEPYSMETLKEKEEELKRLFGQDLGPVQLIVYEWYNGGDEPVIW